MKDKLWKFIRILLWIVELLSAVLAVVWLLVLNMLPADMTVILIVLLTALSVLTAILLFTGGSAKKCRKILGCVLALLVSCGCVAACSVVGDFHGAVSQITGQIYRKEERNVYVLTEDSAQSLEDIMQEPFGIAKGYDEEFTTLAIQAIEENLGHPILVQTFDSVPQLLDALYQGNVRAMILNGGYFGILEEQPAYADYAQRVRVLCKVPVRVTQNDQTAQENNKNPEQDQPKVTQEPFIMYVSGSDTRNQLLSIGNSDVNILAVVNPNTHQVLLLNTPRDYYVPNPAGNGALDKLTHCGVYGIDCSIEALENLYDLEVDYHAFINFTGFVRLIDAIDGVAVYSDVAFTTVHGTYIQAGENYLNGEEALAFARERYHVAGGDNGRGKNQMKVIKAVISKMTSGTTILKNYSEIMESLDGVFSTDMPIGQVSKLVKLQISEMPQWNIQTYAVTGEGGRAVTYSIPDLSLYVMYPDEAMVAYGAELVDRVISGEILTEEDMKMPQ